MTVSDKLIELNSVKQEIKVAIEGKGQDMTGVPFTDYAEKIDAISAGGGVSESTVSTRPENPQDGDITFDTDFQMPLTYSAFESGWINSTGKKIELGLNFYENGYGTKGTVTPKVTSLQYDYSRVFTYFKNKYYAAGGGSSGVGTTGYGWFSKSDDGVNWEAWYPHTGSTRIISGGYYGLQRAWCGVDSNDDFIFRYGLQGNMQRSEDGLNWVELPFGVGLDSTTSDIRHARFNGPVGIAMGNSSYFSRTTNNGTTWTALPRGLGVGGSPAGPVNGSLDVNKTTGVWIASVNTGIFSRSTDNGATWSTALPSGLNSGAAADLIVRYVGQNGSNHVWVAAGGLGYAAISNDDGATWSVLTRGLSSGSTSAAFNSVATDLQGTVIVSGGPGWTAKSTNFGATWAALPNIRALTTTLNVYGMEILNGKCFALRRGTAKWSSSDILASNDLTTFAMVDSACGFHIPDIQAQVLKKVGNKLVQTFPYSTSNTLSVMTTTDGLDWIPAAYDFSNNMIDYNVTSISGNDDIVLVGNRLVTATPELAWSTDGGKVFRHSPPKAFVDYAPTISSESAVPAMSDTNRIFVFVRGYTAYSDDFCKTWTQGTTIETTGSTCMFAENLGGDVWIAGISRIWRSINNGATWTSTPTLAPRAGAKYGDRFAVLTDNNTFVVLSNQGGTISVNRSMASVYQTGEWAVAVDTNGTDTVVCCTNYGRIIFTKDDGVTWHTINRSKFDEKSGIKLYYGVAFINNSWVFVGGCGEHLVITGDIANA